MGVAFDGGPTGVGVVAPGRGDRRSQVTSPSWQRRSSIAGSKWRTPAAAQQFRAPRDDAAS